MRPIRFRLLPNVLVVARQSFVRQIFCTQNQPLVKSTRQSASLKQRHKALRAVAFGALVDVMYKARLVWFGAGKAHFGAAFYALWVCV
jgi:hypothetical protein